MKLGDKEIARDARNSRSDEWESHGISRRYSVSEGGEETGLHCSQIPCLCPFVLLKGVHARVKICIYLYINFQVLHCT